MTAGAMQCAACGQPWEGTFIRSVWTELDRQDHKGPRDVAYANCCRQRAVWYGAHSIPASIQCRYCEDTGRRGVRHDGPPCNSCEAGRKIWARYGL